MTVDVVQPVAEAVVEEAGERGALLLDDHFAPVPEWVLDAEISVCAVRLFAVLLRYGQTSGARMPSWATLARRLRKTSTDTVDRAMKELVALGAVAVERRRAQGVNQTNRYHLRTAHPEGVPAEVPSVGSVGHARPHGPARARMDAATPSPTGALKTGEACRQATAGVALSLLVAGGGRRDAAGGRNGAVGVAARVRPDPESLTHREHLPPNPPPYLGEGLSPLESECAATPAGQLGLPDAAAIIDLAQRCQRLRADAGLAVSRWASRCVLAAVLTALQRGHPADRVPAALFAVAADPAARSPMRLAEAGPWWAQPARPALRRTAQEDTELAELEGYLADRDDRAWLQAQARTQLAAEHEPVDRLGVARRARRLAERLRPAQRRRPVFSVSAQAEERVGRPQLRDSFAG